MEHSNANTKPTDCRAHQITQPSGWDDEMVAIFGAENLEDDCLTEEEVESDSLQTSNFAGPQQASKKKQARNAE